MIIVDSQIDNAHFDADILKSKGTKEALKHFLRVADTGIQGIRIQTTIPEANNHQLQSAATLLTIHKAYDDTGHVVREVEIPLTQESTGTQRIVLIALAILNAQLQHQNKTIFFDEFETGLHEEMLVALVAFFNSEQNENQFVITSHQIDLLDQQLRVDQIYFTEKNFRGESDLYSVFDYGDDLSRSDIAFSKRYRKGQFGAVPIIYSDELNKALRL
ncbi:AAA family ATPase [Secundilactobacillus paracollinoides]|uniref:AAA family ATPase n=1 Tax=Secundilactobacillus paracollinoides TaxID=240427 RepID=UPI00177F82CC|nr:AAA family ATPase [Secundilactobacillus paracollinoides]